MSNTAHKGLMEERLLRYQMELTDELEQILGYWMEYTPDTEHGGFIGRILHDNTPDREAPKGAVLNGRILWTFSAAYEFTRRDDYRGMAEWAFDYLNNHFIDRQWGGVYWTLDHKAGVLDSRKQIYALSFALYGLSEYYRCFPSEAASEACRNVYEAIRKFGYDPQFGGYTEAFARDWTTLQDVRLSEKDANEKKSMNTHLHVLEAFGNYYRCRPTEVLKAEIEALLHIFLRHIVSAEDGHLIGFFTENWEPKGNVASYGHDIEAAWLLLEVASLTGNSGLIEEVEQVSIRLANAAAEGLDADGGLWYELDRSQDLLVREKHSWPQAEAMIGFFNAWQLTGDTVYLEHSLRSWEFVRTYIRDDVHGEWHWGVNADYSPMKEKDRVGLWKCPYHNSRACIELIRRITSVLNKE